MIRQFANTLVGECMSPNPGFQLSLDVKGRACLILGGDEEAAEKTSRLLAAGAKVTVVNPMLNDALRKLAASAKIIHRGRRYRAADAEGVVLIINTVRDPDLARSLFDQANKERFLLCSSDLPALSTVTLPAVVTRGHLRLAISTSGVAPALSSRLREEFEEIFGPEFESFLEWLATRRAETKEREADATQRREALRAIMHGFKFTGHIDYPAEWVAHRAASGGAVER
jgi:precorrin-2 dehydrogenase/sirohydrochlorin ferrochelatase